MHLQAICRFCGRGLNIAGYCTDIYCRGNDSTATNVDYPTFTDLNKRIAKLEAENARLRDKLYHIQEYWNRNGNYSAMHDALYHIIQTCEESLQDKKGGE